jgi:hypothetical protein
VSREMSPIAGIFAILARLLKLEFRRIAKWRRLVFVVRAYPNTAVGRGDLDRCSATVDAPGDSLRTLPAPVGVAFHLLGRKTERGDIARKTTVDGARLNVSGVVRGH